MLWHHQCLLDGPPFFCAIPARAVATPEAVKVIVLTILDETLKKNWQVFFAVDCPLTSVSSNALFASLLLIPIVRKA